MSRGKGTRYSQPHDEGRLIVRLLRRGRTVRFGLQGTLLRREADSGKKGANGAPKRGRRWSFWSGRDLARWRPLRGRVRAFAASGGTDIARAPSGGQRPPGATIPKRSDEVTERRVVLTTRVGSRGDHRLLRTASTTPRIRFAHRSGIVAPAAPRERRNSCSPRVSARAGITDSHAQRARPLGFASLTARGSWHPPL